MRRHGLGQSTACSVGSAATILEGGVVAAVMAGVAGALRSRTPLVKIEIKIVAIAPKRSSHNIPVVDLRQDISDRPLIALPHVPVVWHASNAPIRCYDTAST